MTKILNSVLSRRVQILQIELDPPCQPLSDAHPLNMVKFVHHANFSFDGTQDSSFFTCYKYVMHRWRFLFHPTEPIPAMVVDGVVSEEEHSPQFSLGRVGHGFNFPRPVMVTVRYEYQVYDSAGTLVYTPPPAVSNSREPDNWFSNAPLSRTEANLLIERLLLTGEQYNFYFTLTLDIGDEDFELDLDNPVRFYPLHLDFRHDALSNASRHDFTFICSGGKTFGASREILNAASPYFRNKFRHGDRRSMEEDVDVEVVKVVITYLVCGDYAPPPLMTPSLAKEIIRLAEQYRVMNCAGLIEAVENSCCEQFLLSTGRLEDVLTWLQMTENLFRQTERLTTAVHSTIVTRHWQDFVVEYGDPSTVHRNPIHEILHRRHEADEEAILGARSIFEELAAINSSLATPFVRLPMR